MKKNRQNVAFSLAEILIVLIIVSFLAIILVRAYRKTTINYTTNLMSYAAYNALNNGAYDLAQRGCSATDMGSTSPHPYCGGTIGSASTGFLPAYAVTSDSRGFCNRFVAEEINTVGAVDCSQTATDTTDFKNATPNFTTSNGMRFFNFGSNPANVNYSTLNTTQDVYYSVYVDLDGSAGRGIYNQDVMKFLIGMDGTVLVAPYANFWLASSVKYTDNNGKEVIELPGAVYRKAICTYTQATNVPPRSILAKYCDGLPYGNITPLVYETDYTIQTPYPAPDCTPVGTQSCRFEVDKPALLP